MDRVTHYECGGLGFESLMARQYESTYENGCFYFCVHKIKGLEGEASSEWFTSEVFELHSGENGKCVSICVSP